MKRSILALILILINSSISFSSKSTINTNQVTNTMITEIVVVAKKIDTVELPKSLIADSIFIKQLYAESGNKHFKRDSLGNLTVITNKYSHAKGVAQFLPSTWEWLKKIKLLPQDFSIDNENHQRVAQRIYMNSLANKKYGISYNRVRLALASYNAGYGRVIKLIEEYGYEWETYLPKETQKYINKIIGNNYV